MSASEKGIIAVKGRAHCQGQVAFFLFHFIICFVQPHVKLKLIISYYHLFHAIYSIKIQISRKI